MNVLIKYVIVVLLLSCGERQGFIDPAFSSYVKDFENKIGVKVSNVDIRFEALKPPMLGLCITGGGLEDIKIDPISWINMDDLGRELLLYHELGHCVLFMKHNDSRVILEGLNVEGSIMNAYWFGNTSHYRRYREQYKLALRRNALVTPGLLTQQVKFTPMTHTINREKRKMYE